jgi:hypothetical protein
MPEVKQLTSDALVPHAGLSVAIATISAASSSATCGRPS